MRRTFKTRAMVKTLPFADLQVPVPGFGAMGLNSSMGTDFSFEQSEPVLLKALELGCIFWDTAVSRLTLRGDILVPNDVSKLGGLQEWRKREVDWGIRQEAQCPR
jgi:hypothetical protein